MGGIIFYRKFVSHLSQLAPPLHQLTNQDKFIWFADSQCHFDKLKQALSFAPVLRLYDLIQPFEIETNASQFSIGAILNKGGHPMAYHYETLSDAKVNYSTYEK